MTFGLRVLDGAGRVRMDTGDRVGRLVRREVLPGGTVGTLSVPGYDASNSILFTARLGGIGIGFVDEEVGAHLADWQSPGVVRYRLSTLSATLYAHSLLLVIAFGDS